MRDSATRLDIVAAIILLRVTGRWTSLESLRRRPPVDKCPSSNAIGIVMSFSPPPTAHIAHPLVIGIILLCGCVPLWESQCHVVWVGWT